MLVLLEGIELVTDELRQSSASGRLGLSAKALGVLLHHAVQRSLLEAVAFIVDRGAIAMRLAGRARFSNGLVTVMGGPTFDRHEV